jgi:hypothetical protein
MGRSAPGPFGMMIARADGFERGELQMVRKLH